jgi:hypothetical protein
MFVWVVTKSSKTVLEPSGLRAITPRRLIQPYRRFGGQYYFILWGLNCTAQSLKKKSSIFRNVGTLTNVHDITRQPSCDYLKLLKTGYKKQLCLAEFLLDFGSQEVPFSSVS